MFESVLKKRVKRSEQFRTFGSSLSWDVVMKRFFIAILLVFLDNLFIKADEPPPPAPRNKADIAPIQQIEVWGIVAGVLIATGIIFGGFWVLRRRSKKVLDVK